MTNASGFDTDALVWSLDRLLRGIIDYASHPWFLYQLAIVLVLFAVAKLAARRIERRLEARARTIKGHPGLLRVIIALMRRIDWIVFAALLFGALAVLRATVGLPQTYLVSTLLALTVAWVAAAVISRIIRNKMLARLIAWLAWVYAAFAILGIDDEVATFLDGLAVPLGSARLSALVVVKALILLSATLWIAVTIGNFIDERVQRSKELTPSYRVLIGKVAKIGLVVVAGAIALSSVGVDLTTLTVFTGAIGVGLGFGLQKVISNFVSGLIILLDKSIKPGDTISLGETYGWVRDLRARFVSVVTRDGREYLIPNEDFITQRVINWSFSDDLVRLDVKFRVSYDSDPHMVGDLAVQAAMSVPRVEAERRPVCWITGFGDYAIDFVVRFWIHDPQQGLTNVRGKVLLALWDAFKEAGIEIPYPRQDVTVIPPRTRTAAQDPALSPKTERGEPDDTRRPT